MHDSDDASVYALPITVDYGGRPLEITPAMVETDRGLVLIDVGPRGSVDALEVHLRDVGYELADVRLVVLTHHDADHAGGLADLLERTDAVVATHRDEAPFVRGERDPIKGDGDRYPPVPVDLELVDGARIPSLAGPLTVVATPGHAPGHVSLFVPDRDLLIAGDALVADGEAPLSGPKPGFTPDMESAMESVGRLADLAIDRTLCYHGGYVEAGRDRIAEIRDELRD